MPVSRLTGKSRRYIRRKPKRKTGVKALVKRTVKAQLSKRAETKRLIYGPQDRSLFADEVYYVNPFYSIPVGSSYTQREGNVLTSAWLNCSGMFQIRGTDVVTGADKLMQTHCRIMVVKCNQQLSSTNNWVQTLIGGSFPNLLYNDYHLQSNANRHDYQVLYSKLLKPAPKPYPITISTYGPFVTWNFNVKLGNLRYEDGSNWLKNNQIYIIIWSHNRGAANGDNMGLIQSNYTVTWKDS